jgi:hypothetical protein
MAFVNSRPHRSGRRILPTGTRSHASRMYRALIPLLAALLACSGGRAAEPAMPTYRWEAKKIYRYQFNRKTEITPADPALAGNSRITDCRFILVIEVNSVDANGTATGDLRLMTPQITLPPYLRLSDDEREDVLDTGQSRRNARAMEDILVASKWHITVASNGTIRMSERQPENWRTWMERMEQVGAWPKRLYTKMGDLLDTHFRMGKEDADDEWLPVLVARPEENHEKGLHAFRPRRMVHIDKTTPDGRLRLSLQRENAAEPQPVVVPLLDAEIPPVTLTRGEVKTLAGEAIFDPELGLLDSATERFRAKLTSRCGKLEQQATVLVSHEMRRLAPPLRGEPEAETEKPK